MRTKIKLFENYIDFEDKPKKQKQDNTIHSFTPTAMNNDIVSRYGENAITFYKYVYNGKDEDTIILIRRAFEWLMSKRSTNDNIISPLSIKEKQDKSRKDTFKTTNRTSNNTFLYLVFNRIKKERLL